MKQTFGPFSLPARQMMKDDVPNSVKFVSINVYSCAQFNPKVALEFMLETFNPLYHDKEFVFRGKNLNRLPAKWQKLLSFRPLE